MCTISLRSVFFSPPEIFDEQKLISVHAPLGAPATLSLINIHEEITTLIKILNNALLRVATSPDSISQTCKKTKQNNNKQKTLPSCDCG